MEGEPPGPGEPALREFQALVELAGGKPEVLLVGEVLEAGETRALLGAFAQELFGERPGPAAGGGAAPPPPQVRVCLGPGGAGREIRSRLLFLLCRAGSLQPRRARARLREIARDLRSRLPRAPPAALVGVIVQPGPGEEAAAALLEALLCEVFQGQRPGRQGTVQAAAYSPGRPEGPREVRRAACRALRAALQHRAGGEEREKRRFPSLLRCVPWGRRSQRRGRSANAANSLHEAFPDLPSLRNGRSGEASEPESPL
ncbi:uncharacterized protein C2orf72 homolog isoform 2-T2 [Pangshura tecta]